MIRFDSWGPLGASFATVARDSAELGKKDCARYRSIAI